LFRRGKALMVAGKASEACPLFKESQRLDPQTGTLLNLALCHEATGKVAAAWGEFLVVEQQALAAHPPREDRAVLAREHAASLGLRLSRIKIVVPAAARAPGMIIKVDGEEKGEPAWASGITVDVGTHEIQMSAPRKKTRAYRVRVDDEGAISSMTVEPLV